MVVATVAMTLGKKQTVAAEAIIKAKIKRKQKKKENYDLHDLSKVARGKPHYC